MKKILQFLNENSNQVQNVLNFCINMDQYHSHSYSNEQALALFVSLGLSKQQYINLRKSAQDEHCNIYPSYYQIQQAKQECYPPKNSISISDTFAKITLQSLLDNTAKRILDIKDCQTKIEPDKELTLFGKCGFDGASGQSVYKQMFDTVDSDDSSIFMSAYVPLKLVYSNDFSKIIWENPKPSSTFYCRPLYFKFIKESKEVILQSFNSFKDEKLLLNKTSLSGGISIKHEIYLTMIDGKICSCLAEVSTMVCYICGAKPTEMNNMEVIFCIYFSNRYLLFNFEICRSSRKKYQILTNIL